MKQQLSEENVKALVSYRLSRAKETLAEVPHLRDIIAAGEMPTLPLRMRQ